jgi:hypothetical protein
MNSFYISRFLNQLSFYVYNRIQLNIALVLHKNRSLIIDVFNFDVKVMHAFAIV